MRMDNPHFHHDGTQTCGKVDIGDIIVWKLLPWQLISVMGTSNRKISGLDEHLGYWLRFVSNHVSDSFQKRLAEHDVTVAEWVTMRSLYDAPHCSLNELAQRMGMNKGAVSRLVERLNERGLAVRTQNRDDKRGVTIVLTAEGKRLLPVLAKAADENDAKFFGHLSSDESKHLIELLQGIVERHTLHQKPVN